MKKQPTDLEHIEQAELFKWAAKNLEAMPELWLLNGSLNGVRLKPIQAVMAKRSGMKKGFPDINLPVKRGKFGALYIEMKRIYPKGTVKDEQEEWLQKLTEQGNMAVVCYGFEEARKVIEDYLQLS